MCFIYGDNRRSAAGVLQFVYTITINNQQLLPHALFTVWHSMVGPVASVPIVCHCKTRCKAQVSNCCVSATRHSDCHCRLIARQQLAVATNPNSASQRVHRDCHGVCTDTEACKCCVSASDAWLWLWALCETVTSHGSAHRKTHWQAVGGESTMATNCEISAAHVWQACFRASCEQWQATAWKKALQ